MMSLNLSAFRILATLNSVAILFLLFLASGVLDSLLTPAWLRLPLSVFSAGLVCAFLALFWAQFLAHSRRAGLVRGFRVWFPQFSCMLFLFCSLGAFLVGVWGTVGLASFSWSQAQSSLIEPGYNGPYFSPMHPQAGHDKGYSRAPL